MTEHTLRDRIEQLSAYQVLFTLKFSPLTAHKIAKNIQMLLKEIEPYEEAKKVILKIEGLEEYEKKRVELCEKYCSRTLEGSPVIREGRYAFPTKEDYLLLESEIQPLNKEYAAALQEKEAFELELVTLLDTPVDVPLLEIDISSGKGDIAPATLFPLMGFLKE